MKNPCLEAALRELNNAGIRDIERSYGGKHLQLRWRANGRGLRTYPVPMTPSDWRSSHNVAADIRRMLREDGMLMAVPPKSSKPPDRISRLEARIAALEAEVAAFRTAQTKKE